MAINHAEIAELSKQLFDAETRRAFSKISSQVIAIAKARYLGKPIDPAHLSALRDSVLGIDSAIGGIGLDRLLVPISGGYTGHYPIDERSIHRPLQYALDEVLHGSRPRYAVLMSCQHIESILKKRYEGVLPRVDHMPMGSIVGQIRAMKLLEAEITGQLMEVVHVLNIAKHEYGPEAVCIPDPLRRIDSQVFNVHEAVSMYFICRKLGVYLLSDS